MKESEVVESTVVHVVTFELDEIDIDEIFHEYVHKKSKKLIKLAPSLELVDDRINYEIRNRQVVRATIKLKFKEKIVTTS